MLDLMRKHARSWSIQALLFAVIIVFVFWGVGSYREGKSNKIAIVNDHPITFSEYKISYENLLKRYKGIYKDQWSEKLIDRLKLKEMAMELLIERTLLLQEAERINLEVTRKELRESIMAYPAFQKDGVFDNSQYMSLLRYSKMMPEEFEDSQRADLLIKKIEELIKDNVKVSDKELFDVYTIETESVNLEFIRLQAASFLNKTTISDDEIRDYFSNNKGKYEIPAKVRVQYLRFNPKDYEHKVKVSDSDINDYYDFNKENFTVPEKVKARHILVRAPHGADPESLNKARERAEKILEDFRRGTDFAVLATKYSDDPSAKTGGDLGLIEREKLMAPIRDAVSLLKGGEVSPVIQSAHGFHIIKVEKVIDGKTKPLKEVKPLIISALTREKAQDLADDEVEDTHARIFDEEGLAEFASDAKIDLHKTDLFSADEGIKGVGKDRIFSDAAFALEKGEISEVVRSSDVNYILEVTEKEVPRIPQLKEVKDKVKKDVQKEKGKVIARTKAEKFLEGLNKGDKWERLVSKNKLKTEETGFFTRRDDAIPKIGYSEKIVGEAFSLAEDNPFAKKVFEVNNTYFVIKLKGKKGIDREDFESVKDNFRKVLMEYKKKEVFREWLYDLKAKAEVKRDLSSFW